MASQIKTICFALLLIAVGSCHNTEQGLLDGSSSGRASINHQPVGSKPNVDESVQGDFEVRQGMLFFRSLDTYLTLKDKMNAISSNEQIAFAKKIGFVSALQSYDEALLTLSNTQDKDLYDKILKENQTLLSTKDGAVTPTFSFLHAALMNRENMVSIGKAIHSFTKDATIIAVNGDPEEVRQATKSLTSTSKNIKVFRNNKEYSKGGRRAASCSGFNKTGQSTDGQRQIQLTSGLGADSYLQYTDPAGGNYYAINVYSLVEGTAFKKNFFGNWVSYSTGNTMNAVYSVDITYPTAPGSPVNYSRNLLFSNNSHVIQDKVTVNSASWVPENQAFSYCPCFYSATYNEAVPTPGYYNSGGVPSGVPLACP